MELVRTGLAIHHYRGSGAILYNIANKGRCCSSVNLSVGSLFTEHRVEIEIVMIHEHVYHVGMHPSVVNDDFGAATRYNIVFFFLNFMREYRTFSHADTHFPSC